MLTTARAGVLELVFWPNGFPIEKLLFSKKSQAELMFLAGIAMSVVGGLVGSRVSSRVGSQSSGLGRQLDAKRYDDDMTTDALTTNGAPPYEHTIRTSRSCSETTNPRLWTTTCATQMSTHDG